MKNTRSLRRRANCTIKNRKNGYVHEAWTSTHFVLRNALLQMTCYIFLFFVSLAKSLKQGRTESYGCFKKKDLWLTYITICTCTYCLFLLECTAFECQLDEKRKIFLGNIQSLPPKPLQMINTSIIWILLKALRLTTTFQPQKKQHEVKSFSMN